VAEFVFKLAFGMLLGVALGLPAGAVAFVYQLSRGHSLVDAGRVACCVLIQVVDRVLDQI